MLLRVVLVTLIFLAASSAQAQGNPAIAAGRKGIDAHSSGDWESCEKHFARANTLMHSPVFLLYLARCKAKLNKLLEARDLYEELAKEDLPADAPKPWQDAKRDGIKERGEVVALIPSLRIHVSGAPEGAVVQLDGTSFALEVAEDGISVDPGTHRIVVTIYAAGIARREIVVAAGGGATEIEIDIDEESPSEEEGSIVPGVVLVGVGGAGLLLGAIFGGLALDRESEAKAGCEETKECSPAQLPAKEDAETFSHVATAGFVIGGVAAAVGVALIIWRPGGGDAEVALSPTRAKLSVTF